jgi:hypothetical protein
MLKISRTTLERMLKATKWVERHMQNTGGKRARWQPRGSGQRIVFGKLKSALAYDDTDPTGVDVDVYSDPSTDAEYDIEDVLPPPWMEEGTIASGSWIELKSWGGNWYVFRVPESIYDRCTGLLQGALDSGDGSITVDGLAAIRGVTPGSSVTAYNVHGWDGDDNAPCRIEWNKTTEHWELYQVTCPS